MITGRKDNHVVISIKKNEEGIRLVTFFAFLVVVCLPFHTLTIGGVGLLMLIGLPLLALSGPALLNRLRRTYWDPATILLAGFFGYNLLSYLLSPSYSSSSTYNYIKIISIVMCLYCQEYSKREKQLLMAGSVISCLVVCWFLLTESNVEFYSDRVTIAVFGVVQDPNYLGYLFLIPMAVATDGFLKEKRIVLKIIYGLLAVLILLCVMIGGSRGVFLGIAAIVVVCTIKKFEKLWSKILFCVVMAAIAAIIYGFVLTLLPEHTAERFSIQAVVESRGTKRLDIWMDAFRVMGEKPYKLLFGFGAGSSNDLLNGWATHNFFIQLLLELGIVGLGLFVSFLWMWVKRLAKCDTLCLGVLLGGMAMAMTLSVNTVYYYWVVFILGIVCSEAKQAYRGGNTR